MHYYLAGGAVRDLLRGQKPREYDYVFDASVADFLAMHPQARCVGKSVQVFILNNTEYMPLRDSLKQDLLARDFTINALLLEENGILHTHPLALADLKAKILRPASPTALHDDPVRAFRAARFAAQFPDFTVHPELYIQMHALANSEALNTIPAERISRELLKALAAPSPSRWLSVLHTGTICIPHYEKSVLQHTCTIMDKVAGNPLAVWMALCHDLGKSVPLRSFRHEQRGARLSQKLAKQLALPRLYRTAAAFACRWHSHAARYQQLRPSLQRDLLWQLHGVEQLPGFVDAFLTFLAADCGHSSTIIADDLAFIRTIHFPEADRHHARSTQENGVSAAERGKILRAYQCHALADRRYTGRARGTRQCQSSR